ncbi:MAG: pseudouridine synthase [Desulfopila sp.]
MNEPGRPIRLQKYLAQCGVASRRKSESLITAGRVSIDGQIVRDMGVKIVPEEHQVLFDGKKIALQETRVYILLNKPKGYVTTLADPQGRPVVTDLVKDSTLRLFPVGRLDLDTEGALLLTNDGELANKIQHPSHEVTKTYEAIVSGYPSSKKLSALEKGISLEGKMTSPASLRIVNRYSSSSRVQIIIHEGRKRQVRKMFEAIGHPVINLKRLAYGSLSLGSLGEGDYRRLTSRDVLKIFKNIPLQKKK